MAFRPEEVLFSPTTECNLRCPHCVVPRSRSRLSKKTAIRFLDECVSLGVKRVGFTGGEPFLAIDFLASVIKAAVNKGFLFDNITTNGVWWHAAQDLSRSLKRIQAAGYDGSICLSYDALHGQSPRKAARFIEEAARIWQRPDVVSLAIVTGARDAKTSALIASLARALDGKVARSIAGRKYIKSPKVFVKITEIELAPVGTALFLKDPWDGRWFREDNCAGPGNVFLVMPDGDVKPCCGYASDDPALTIGNIHDASARQIVKKLKGNRFARTVFNSGLSVIRRRLEKAGVRFPGKTSNHCFFCDYILNTIPKGVLNRCLDR